MAFSAQTFSVGQVLTASQMNQVDSNIDAVRTSHKGSTAPSDLTAGVLWLEDDNPSASVWTLQLYDGTDWIELFQIDTTNDAVGNSGTWRVGNGSVSSPSLSFLNDTDTGIYRGSNANELLFATAGTLAGLFDSSQLLILGHDTSISIEGAIKPPVQIHSSGRSIGLYAYAASNQGPNLYFIKSRSATIGSRAIVQNGDNLGYLQWWGDDNSGGAVVAAAIHAEVNGVPGNDDMPGSLIFATTANGAASTTEHMSIDNLGQIRATTELNTTGSAANVFYDTGSTQRFLRSTSSLRYKRDVRPITDAEADRLLQLQPIAFRSLAEADDPDRIFYGLGAEDVAVVDSSLVGFSRPSKQEVIKDENGKVSRYKQVPDMDEPLRPDSVQYDRIVPGLLNLVKRHESRIAALEASRG